MKQYFLGNAYALWNGMAFYAITGYFLNTWQWWAFTIPMVLFVELAKWNNK